jgi:hypothetical protein
MRRWDEGLYAGSSRQHGLGDSDLATHQHARIHNTQTFGALDRQVWIHNSVRRIPRGHASAANRMPHRDGVLARVVLEQRVGCRVREATERRNHVALPCRRRDEPLRSFDRLADGEDIKVRPEKCRIDNRESKWVGGGQCDVSTCGTSGVC